MDADKPKLLPGLKRAEVLGLATLVLGAAVTGFWMARQDVSRLSSELLGVNPIAVVAALAISVSHLCARWMRWHLFLRRSQVRIPTKYSVEIFCYGLLMILTPAYAGECAKAWPIKARFGYRARIVVAVVVAERLFDVLALVILWAVGSSDSLFMAIAACVVILLMAGFARVMARVIGFLDRARQLALLRQAVAPAADVLLNLFTGVNFLLGLAISLAAWSMAGLGLKLIIWGLHQQCGWLEAQAMFARSTILGALTLIPGGVGISGSLLLMAIRQAGLPASTASVAVFLVRAVSIWFAVFIGAATILWRAAKTRAGVSAVFSGFHFDQVSETYDAEIPIHVRDHVVSKKIVAMLPRLKSALPNGGEGLDIGCGRGWYLRRITAEGYRVTGIDLSLRQAVSAGELLRQDGAEAPVALADVCRLPFASESFDFAYTINVLHHLPTAEDQVRALEEIARVLRPGGIFFLHEINVTNQLFRFHMNYVFPLIHNIDEGTERWLKPFSLPQSPSLKLKDIEYMTFVPDFGPAGLFKSLLLIESRLEKSRLRSWSAHYMAVYGKPA
ncbi:MAG TPA: lysylphosphatidylglycerol synthase domain-containing protein [Candidatus Brocadiia bacterium]|nr:lysylphosphatidylglycerol synthase domain-containing protein [Candidatus Brocadiia bacterium]